MAELLSLVGENQLLPDMLAISDPEVELPTLNMNSDQLNELSLSGIINTYVNAQEQEQATTSTQGQHNDGSTITVDPNTISGQANQITFHLEPVRDIRDSLVGFQPNGNQQQQQVMENWNMTNNQQFANAAPGMSVPQEQKPHVKILEQPASHKLRFRYQCEGRGAGALQGQSSTPDKKTFPKIQIVGYKGAAVVVVSCVTHDADPPKAHPHNLVSPASVGRDGCKKGVCTVNVNNEDMTVEFQHLGIQCVRKKDIGEALKQRQEIRVDPFRQGFSHADSSGSIDLNAVKLCFQVFLENPNTPGKYTVILPPVCSKPIFDAKAKKELQIMDISDNTSPVEGQKKIIILCERVARDDIKVKFYDPLTGWEDWGDFNAADVHKQYAISLKTPRFDIQDIQDSRRVMMELVKPSDGSTSDALEFFYVPNERSNTGLKRDKDGVSTSESNNISIPKVNMYNGGGFVTSVPVKSEQNDPNSRLIKKESTDNSAWKQMTSQIGHLQPTSSRVDPYSKVVLAQPGNIGLASAGMPYSQTTGGQMSNGYMQLQGDGQQAYNIQHSPQQQHQDNTYNSYMHSPSYTHVDSPYQVPQQSPDSQGLANLNLTSPPPANNLEATLEQASNLDAILGQLQGHQGDQDVDNLSGKLRDIDFCAPNMAAATATTSTPRTGGKRSSRDAENESGSNIVPRQMDRQQSSIQTPNVSAQLSGQANSTDLSQLLSNCRQMNDLG